MSTFANEYKLFWSQSLGLSVAEFESPSAQFSTGGTYLKKFPARGFFFEDLLTGKKVFCGNPSAIAELTRELGAAGLEGVDHQSIRQLTCLKRAKLEFRDCDFYLFAAQDFLCRPTCHHRVVALRADTDLEDFYSDADEDERDMLDLEFSEGEKAFAVVDGEHLLAVSRYLKIRRMPSFADLTILVRRSARGKGMGVPLMSATITALIGEGMMPKYRVAEDNLASLSIARNLGLVEGNKILAWSYNPEI